jgi:tripartite-type tricarboxylate transporter receptor subunit TctC
MRFRPSRRPDIPLLMVLTKLHRELARIIALPDVQSRFASQGYDAVTSTPQEFSHLIKNDLAKWRKVVKASGARVD